MAYVSASLRQLVTDRAKDRCEYCLFPTIMSSLAFEMEHIIAEKHGGESEAENLALACPYCNRFKGSDLGSLDPESGDLVPFFNPRTQDWHEHFSLGGAEVVPLTAVGRVTVKILQLNDADRLLERQLLIEVNRYP